MSSFPDLAARWRAATEAARTGSRDAQREAEQLARELHDSPEVAHARRVIASAGNGGRPPAGLS